MTTSDPTPTIPPRPFAPRETFPARAPGSVRRVMHLDYEWVDGVDVVVTGAARDEIVEIDGSVTVEDTTALAVETGNGLITRFDLQPAAVDASAFLGHPLRQGFRALVRDVLPHDGGTAGLLLDDVSGAMVAAGYVLALDDRLDGTRSPAGPSDEPAGAPAPEATTNRMEGGGPTGPGAGTLGMADLCSGWRSDGAMMTMVRAGERMRFRPIPPVAARPDGADGWPERAIPRPGLRRHRRMDVVDDGATWRVDAWFRDTYSAPDGSLGSLHEYSVDASVDAAHQTLLAVHASPHALPWVECPAAADAVTKLVGLQVGDLRATVQRTLLGIESCTHLTNELRELADLPTMVSRARR